VARLRALGAHHVHDRLAGDWVAAVKAATGGRGIDLAVDSVGEALWAGVLRSLAVRGRVVCYGATTGARVSADLRHVFWKQLSILGTTMGTPAEYRTVMERVFRGEIHAPVHEVIGLDEVRRGHELLEAGGVFGKLVVVPDGNS
jgi:NADPH2:quinone reductase